MPPCCVSSFKSKTERLQKLLELDELYMGKQKIDVNVKYATCVTSGLRVSTKVAFSDAPHQGRI
jgi:hypothetical protein